MRRILWRRFDRRQRKVRRHVSLLVDIVAGGHTLYAVGSADRTRAGMPRSTLVNGETRNSLGGIVPFAALGLPAPIVKGVRAAGYEVARELVERELSAISQSAISGLPASANAPPSYRLRTLLEGGDGAAREVRQHE